MPVSATAIVIQSRPAWAAMVTVPFSVNLFALLARLSSAWRNRIWSAWIVPRSRRTIDDDTIAVLRRHGLDRLGHVLDQWRQREQFEVKLHPPRLDLGQVEDVVDQREQMAARAEHPIERLDVLLKRLGILPQHLGDANDGVERRAQLMAHAGEELRLVLACEFELAALVLDFLEQPHVLDRDRRLVGEGRNQLDLLVGEWPHLQPRQGQDADGTPSRNMGTPSMVRKPPSRCASYRCNPDRLERRERE